MKIKKILCSVATIALFATLITGCGGSNSSSPTTKTPSPTVTPTEDKTTTKDSGEGSKDITGITFESKKFDYDGNEHQITITGQLPEGTSVSYSSNVSGITNKATNVGKYEIKATISGSGYKTLELTAILQIVSNDKERNIVATNSGVFFENAMDNDKVYFYDGLNVKKVSNSSTLDMIKISNNQVAYSSDLLEQVGMGSFGTYTVSSGNINKDNFINKAASYIQKNGTKYYFAVNSLKNAAIYSYDTETEELTKLSDGKAYYLQLDSAYNEIYFADGANGNKLSKISLSSPSERTVVVDAKINNLIMHNGCLFYTVNNLLGDYIEKLTLLSNVRLKITQDAGASLTVFGDDLYYVNVDKLTTRIVGDGIFKVSTKTVKESSAPGTKVIDGGDYGVCSLATDGTFLYYYDIDNYKLIKYNVSTKQSINILDGFVKPADPTPTSFGGKVLTYGDTIFYQDIYDNKALHSYNVKTKVEQCVTDLKVADFSIIGDYLFINMVSKAVDNNTYVIDIKNGGEPQLINNYSASDMCTDGTYIYYILDNASGVATAIHKCKLDGTDDVEIYDKGVSNLRYTNGRLLFIDENNIHVLDLTTNVDTEVEVEGRSIHTTVFDTDGVFIYYRDMYGIGYTSKRLAKCKLDGTDDVKLVDNGKTDPISIVYKDGYVYYYCDTTKPAQNGLFKVGASGTSSTDGTSILPCNQTYYAETFSFLGNNIYFLNYSLGGSFGDSKIYVVPATGGAPELMIK